MHWHRWDLVPQLSIFLLLVSYGNKLELLQIHQLHYMSSPEGPATNVILNLWRCKSIPSTFSQQHDLPLRDVLYYILSNSSNYCVVGCLSCGFLSLGTWSLHSSSNKHVMRPKLENFVALLKLVSHLVTSRLALKWFQLLYVIIFLSILEGGKKMVRNMELCETKLESLYSDWESVLAKLPFSSFDKVWIEQISSHGALSKPW